VRRSGVHIAILTAMVAGFSHPSFAQQPIIAAIQVHGNTLTPNEDVIKASGLSVGAPFVDSLLESTAERLKATKQFQDVEVLKRYASITDATQIVVLIQVDQGPVHIVAGVMPGSDIGLGQ
jgi:outer membrane protein assembly factor BamA